MKASTVLTASGISCLVIPDGCLGIPTLAALEQGIPVIAVANPNLMANDLAVLPWKRGQFYQVKNYYEAAGVLLALRSGIDAAAIRRPLGPTRVTSYSGDRVRDRVGGPSKHSWEAARIVVSTPQEGEA